MAKSGALLSAVCILALATIAYSKPKAVEFYVSGYVYCDPCRVEFETKLAYPLEGASVKLECRNVTTESVTYLLEGKTDNRGLYKLTAKGDHEDEICEVRVVKSPKADCSVPFKAIEKARVLLTENSGMSGDQRLANPLGFMTQTPAAACKETLDAMGFIPFDFQL